MSRKPDICHASLSCTMDRDLNAARNILARAGLSCANQGVAPGSMRTERAVE
jgi:transposase